MLVYGWPFLQRNAHGQAVKNTEALANPEALDYFRDRAELAH